MFCFLIKSKKCAELLVLFSQICAASVVLLVLNENYLNIIRFTPQNRVTPVAIVTSVTLYATVVWNCCLFQPEGGVLVTVCGIVEMFAVVFTLPVVFNLWTVCWVEAYWWSDRLVVFLAPVYFLFIFAATTVASWILAAYGLVVSFWLIKYKLPLYVER